MNRWLLVLLAIVGGAIAAYIAVMFIGGGLIGVLWLFVFGDNPWPQGWEAVLSILLVLIGLFFWFRFARAIWGRLRPA